MKQHRSILFLSLACCASTAVAQPGSGLPMGADFPVPARFTIAAFADLPESCLVTLEWAFVGHVLHMVPPPGMPDTSEAFVLCSDPELGVANACGTPGAQIAFECIGEAVTDTFAFISNYPRVEQTLWYFDDQVIVRVLRPQPPIWRAIRYMAGVWVNDVIIELPSPILAPEIEARFGLADAANAELMSVSVLRITNGTQTMSHVIRRRGDSANTSPGWVTEPDGSFSLNTSGPAAGTIRATNITVVGTYLDLNGDGRFNASDIEALEDLVGSGNANLDQTRRFDLLPSGGLPYSPSLGAEDVEALQILLEAGADDGVFGDVNRDGAIDCLDYHLAFSRWGSTVGQAGYAVELDLDLDGNLDPNERSSFESLIATADINRDGEIDTLDVTAFYDAFRDENPIADMNRDGEIDNLDVVVFFDKFRSGC